MYQNQPLNVHQRLVQRLQRGRIRDMGGEVGEKLAQSRHAVGQDLRVATHVLHGLRQDLLTMLPDLVDEALLLFLRKGVVLLQLLGRFRKRLRQRKRDNPTSNTRSFI